jgi:hypothetical protein
MKRNKHKYYLILMMFALIAGCERKYSWDFQTENSNRLVVDGILTNELKSQCIKLSLSNPYMNQAFRPYSGAMVDVSDSIHDYTFSESSDEPGSYYSAPFQAVINRNYKLTIVADSIYTAEDHMVAVTRLEAFLTQKNDTNDFSRYIYVEEEDPAMVEVHYDWSGMPSYCEKYGNCMAMETFYTIKTIDVNKSFAPDKEIIWFPSGTVISRKKYSLSPEHQDFLRSLLMETQWSGGLFDVQHGNVNTNLTNGALGFFGVCMVVADTTVFQ